MLLHQIINIINMKNSPTSWRFFLLIGWHAPELPNRTTCLTTSSERNLRAMVAMIQVLVEDEKTEWEVTSFPTTKCCWPQNLLEEYKNHGQNLLYPTWSCDMLSKIGWMFPGIFVAFFYCLKSSCAVVTPMSLPTVSEWNITAVWMHNHS